MLGWTEIHAGISVQPNTWFRGVIGEHIYGSSSIYVCVPSSHKSRLVNCQFFESISWYAFLLKKKSWSDASIYLSSKSDCGYRGIRSHLFLHKLSSQGLQHKKSNNYYCCCPFPSRVRALYIYNAIKVLAHDLGQHTNAHGRAARGGARCSASCVEQLDRSRGPVRPVAGVKQRSLTNARPEVTRQDRRT